MTLWRAAPWSRTHPGGHSWAVSASWLTRPFFSTAARTPLLRWPSCAKSNTGTVAFRWKNMNSLAGTTAVRSRARRSVRRQVEEDNAKCRADPARAERRRQAFENVAELMQSFKKADHEIMRWRVRLYCGHIIETEAHYTYTDPLSAGSYGRRCSECGEDRQTIVAFEPIGLRGEPPEPTESTPPPPPKKPTRADLERRVKTLEKENERLRTKLTG